MNVGVEVGVSLGVTVGNGVSDAGRKGVCVEVLFLSKVMVAGGIFTIVFTDPPQPLVMNSIPRIRITPRTLRQLFDFFND